MRKFIIYIVIALFAVIATAKPFKVVSVATVTHKTTDTVQGTTNFTTSYKGDMDTVAVYFEKKSGFATIDSAIVTYWSSEGNIVSKEVVSSFDSLGESIKGFTYKMDKEFPAALKATVSLKYTYQGMTSGSIYYIIY